MKKVYYYLGNRCLVTNSAKEERKKYIINPESGTSNLFNLHPLDKHEVHLSWPHVDRAGPKPQKKKAST